VCFSLGIKLGTHTLYDFNLIEVDCNFFETIYIFENPRRSLSAMVDKSRDCYQHVVIQGLPYERGLQHGTILREKIRFLIDLCFSRNLIPPWDYCQKFIGQHYIPELEKRFPTGLLELQGIADGSGSTLDEIVMLNSRYDLSRSSPKHWNHQTEECTSVAIIDEGGVKVAQNWDMAVYSHDLDTIVLMEIHTSPEENLPKVIIALSEVGQLVRSGMNSKGLGITANSLWSSDDEFSIGKKERNTYMPLTLARRLFLESNSYGAALKRVLSSPRHVSANVMTATRECEAIDLEIAPSCYFPHYLTEFSNSEEFGFIVHANHFSSPLYNPAGKTTCCYPGGSSLFRDRRVSASIRRTFEKNRVIRSEDIEQALTDHVSFPQSVCEHPDIEEVNHGTIKSKTMTVASVVYDLTNGIIRLCKGPPCQGVWKTYSIDME
jgi:isopenicillin-N N-acyltransferase-like protein